MWRLSSIYPPGGLLHCLHIHFTHANGAQSLREFVSDNEIVTFLASRSQLKSKVPVRAGNFSRIHKSCFAQPTGYLVERIRILLIGIRNRLDGKDEAFEWSSPISDSA